MNALVVALTTALLLVCAGTAAWGPRAARADARFPLAVQLQRRRRRLLAAWGLMLVASCWLVFVLARLLVLTAP